MAARSIHVTDLRELIRLLRKGEADRRIARDLSLSRNTVAKYRSWAVGHDLLGETLPSEAAIDDLLQSLRRDGRALHETSSVEPYREQVQALVMAGVEAQAAWRILAEQHGFTGSYSSVKRFVRAMRGAQPPESFLRLEVEPGEEAQVDFGYAGVMHDAARDTARRAWVFVMTLSHSRHAYAEIVFDQSVETWTRLHVNAFEFFGGVPRRIVLDNLKAGIVQACLHDPEVQRSYRDLALHYDFMISPCRPRTPEHKGKVESGVRYVKRNALAGRTFRDAHEANAHLLRWCRDVAGRRTHGTTRQVPLEVFAQAEQPALQPLPETSWEASTFKTCKLHRDCHVIFDRSYYSAPCRLVGKNLLVRATSKLVQVFHEHELVAVHVRSARPGTWCTLQDHLPPDKVIFLTQSPTWCRQRAAEIGSATTAFIERLLGDRPMDRRRSAQAVLRLAQRHGTVRLEAACARALAFEELRVDTVRTILVKGLDREPLALATPPPVMTPRHARPWTDFFPASTDGGRP